LGSFKERSSMDNFETIEKLEAIIKSLPKGSISKKVIRGKVRYYLQWRDGTHIRNLFIREADTELIMNIVKFRKELEQIAKNLQSVEEQIIAEKLNQYQSIVESISDNKTLCEKYKISFENKDETVANTEDMTSETSTN